MKCTWTTMKDNQWISVPLAACIYNAHVCNEHQYFLFAVLVTESGCTIQSTIPSKDNLYLQFLLKVPAADWIIYDESPQDYTRENSSQHEILWKQFTLNVAKGMARKILVHGYPCTGDGGIRVKVEVYRVEYFNRIGSWSVKIALYVWCMHLWYNSGTLIIDSLTRTFSPITQWYAGCL